MVAKMALLDRTSIYFPSLNHFLKYAEAIILAKELNADLLILDEKLARDYAKKLNVKITGTLGVLLKAKELGLVDTVRELLDILVKKGVWLSPKLIEKVLNLAGEQL